MFFWRFGICWYCDIFSFLSSLFLIKKNFILKILTVVIAQSENWYLSVKMKGAPIKSEKRKEEINVEKIN